MLKFDVISVFPNIFKGFLDESLIARGQKKKIIRIKVHDLRRWAKDRHKTVDDRPFGGGPGMVLKIEPLYRAVQSFKSKFKNQKLKFRRRIILFSPRGKPFTQKDAKRLARYDQLILICGRYEGVDERVAKHIADEVFSAGDYVLNGGEVVAMAVIEAVSRMVPGFIAKKESAGKNDFPQYTRPEVFVVKDQKPKTKAKTKTKNWKVPKVLLSGDHKKIADWRRKRFKIS